MAIKFVSLDQLEEIVKAYIDSKDSSLSAGIESVAGGVSSAHNRINALTLEVAKKYETITYNSQTRTISFYKNDGTGTPDVTITLPADVDISGKMDKMSGATAGNVVKVSNDGTSAVDSGVALSDLATKQELENAITGMFVVVDSLPTASADTLGAIYLVPNQGQSPNVKDEYVTVRSGSVGAYTYAWELIGTTEVDLSGYVQTSRTIAGVDLADNITKAELLTALNVADGANVTTVNTTNKSVSAGGNTISGIWTDGDYTVATDAEVEAIFE